MKPTKSFEINDKMKDRIISVAYNDANVFKKATVYFASLFKKDIKSELESYRRTARLVHSLGEETCPDKIFADSKTKNLPAPGAGQSFTADLLSLFLNKPIASALTTLALVLIIVATIVFNRPTERKYSDHELKLADKQAKYALQLIGTIMGEAQQTLKNEILTDRVARPISEGLEIVNTLLKEK